MTGSGLEEYQRRASVRGKTCIVKGCGKPAYGYSHDARYTAAFFGRFEADENNPSTSHLCEKHWDEYWLPIRDK